MHRSTTCKAICSDSEIVGAKTMVFRPPYRTNSPRTILLTRTGPRLTRPPGYPSVFTRESKDTALNELLSSVLQLQPYRGPEGAGPAMFCGKTLKFREKWDWREPDLAPLFTFFLFRLQQNIGPYFCPLSYLRTCQLQYVWISYNYTNSVPLMSQSVQPLPDIY